MSNEKTAKVTGRPKNAKGRTYAQSQLNVSRCPNCQSTNRTHYENPVEVEAIGEEDGKPYDTVIWRTCRCTNCGQWRRDRSTEYRRSGPHK